MLVPCGRALVLIASLIAGLAAADPAVKARAVEGSGFRIHFSAFAFRLAPLPPELGVFSDESLIRLPGDPDSVLTLGGPVPSGEPRLRFAIEVNEAVLKLIPPDPRVRPDDTRSRAGGDWHPVDATGRPYQLRLGARLVW
ncbi:MAG: hypothetical protein ACYDBY_00630 [Thermoanaerobaculia bacterium]